MKKYQPAGGVVPLTWRPGYPHGAIDQLNSGQSCLAEVWESNLTYNQKHVSIHARIVPLTKDPMTGHLLFGGERLNARECRRWCVLRSHTTYVPLNLSVWDEPKEY